MGLIAQVYGNGGRTVVIREFLTVPLFALAPLLWTKRKSLWLLCQHNIGLSVNNGLHRRMMRLLYAAGFNFLVYDTVEVFAPIAPPRPGRVVAIPFPVSEIARPDSPVRRPAQLVIGFVGAFRPEKSPEWAIRRLSDAIARGQLPSHVSLLLGNDDQHVRAQWAHVARTVDTDSYADFLGALAICDILVLPYDEQVYQYRCSGVFSEAVALSCLIVAPDIPGLHEQVSLPQSVGALYAGRDALEDALLRAIAMTSDTALPQAFAAQQRHRSLDGLMHALLQLPGASRPKAGGRDDRRLLDNLLETKWIE
jgi:glycosyltransferase involved in cell wall biosynthesis